MSKYYIGQKFLTKKGDYVHVPTMTDEDRKNYPKEGDASYIRRTGFRKNG